VTERVTTGEQVLNQWDRIKENVEGRKSVKTILDEVPEGFPPLLRAYKMQKKAAKKGFDWQSIESVSAKVYEELEEVREAFQALQNVKSAGDTSGLQAASDGRNAPLVRMSPTERVALHLEEEFGDLLFAVVNYMRHAGVDPETAMDRANRKFYRRFAYVEERMTESGIPMDGDHLQDEDAFWNAAKKSGL